MIQHYTGENNPQPLINMSNIQVGGGIIGLVFSIGTILIFLTGIPSLRWFPVGAVAMGSVISFGLKLFHERKPARPASIRSGSAWKLPGK
jgi:hypothetical protein